MIAGVNKQYFMSERINYFGSFLPTGIRDTDALERNANDYPYSSLTGFLLLYHYKQTNHPGFEKLAKKTVLHFKNPHWLQFLLDQTPHENNQPRDQRHGIRRREPKGS